MSRMIYADPDY